MGDHLLHWSSLEIRSPQDLYSLLLIQSDGQSVQWKGWFAANDMVTPTNFGLAFDRSGGLQALRIAA
ncbi:hypothetical protein [Pseudomonas reidholzensis]|uniref:hypothetical protein n=1 Tax=Pseudomonas reidholzensis TaxID=1785162 RepID=UPI001ABF4E54|nr:hypothetical protein [Pseudomonas reidholzensis]